MADLFEAARSAVSRQGQPKPDPVGFARGLVSAVQEMRATPRNPVMGWIADALTAANDYAQNPDPTMPMGKANPVLGLLADAASLNSLATTAQRASYGEPLTNGLRGSKPFLKPETADALMMAPISPRTALGALGMAGGMADNSILKSMLLYHGTTPEAYESIMKDGFLRGGNYFGLKGKGVALSPRRDVAEAFSPSGHVVVVDVNPRNLSIDRESVDDPLLSVSEALRNGNSVYWRGSRLPVKIQPPEQTRVD